MRVLLDECVPKRLRSELSGHNIRTVPERGWSGKKNGLLSQLMASHGFEVLLTVDRSLRFQQQLQPLGLAAIVLIAPSNRLADLRPLMPAVQAALQTIKPGDVIEVTQ